MFEQQHAGQTASAHPIWVFVVPLSLTLDALALLLSPRIARQRLLLQNRLGTGEESSAEQAVVLVFDHLVALADRRFEAAPVEYVDAAAHVADEPLLL